MRDKLLRLDLDRMLSIEECIDLSAYARSLEYEYEFLEIDMPEALNRSIVVLRDEITKRKRAEDESELRKLQGALDGLKSASERKTDVLAQIAAVQKRLGLKPAKGATR